MKLVAVLLLFWALCFAGISAMGCFAFSIPDSRASPIVPAIFIVLAIVFARAGAGLWRCDTNAALRIYHTIVAGPLLGVAMWLTGFPDRPGAYLLAITLGSILYATFAIWIGRQAAHVYGPGAPAS